MVATEGGAQLAGYSLEFRGDKQSRHWQTVADALSYTDKVGFDARILVGEELTASAVTRLDFVEDEDCVGIVAGLA